MKHQFCKKTAAAVMALLLVTGNLPVKPAADLLRTAVITAHAEDPAPTSGTCGENAVWELTENPKENEEDDTTYTLTISGSGAMENYESDSSVGWYGYYSQITKVVIGDGITSIGKFAFSQCTKLSEADLPGSVTAIEDFAFMYCPALSTITLPDNLTKIGTYAFYTCSALTSVSIPGSVDAIGDQAFNNCGALESVTISEGVTKIGFHTFCACNALTSVTIPASMKVIDEYAFIFCNGLTSVTISEGVENLNIKDYAFTACSALKDINIPDGVASIGSYAFSNCSSLTSLTIPAHVQSIGTSLLSRSGVTDIYCYADPGLLLKSDVLSGALDTLTIHALCFKEAEYTAAYPNATNIVYDLDVNAVTGASLSLSGEIGVNVYFSFTEDLSDDAYVAVKGPNDAEASITKISELPENEDGKYVSCAVYAAQLGEEITFELYDENGELLDLYNSKGELPDTFTYSANDYINSVKDDAEQPENLRNLASAIQNYAAWTRQYFGDRTAEIAEPVSVEDVDASMLEDYKMTVSDDYAVSDTLLSLILESRTAIRLYYSGDQENIAVNGTDSFTVGTMRDRNYIEITNVGAQQLDDMYSVTFGDKGFADVSALSYAYSVLKAYDGNAEKEALCNTVRALYLYNRAAESYVRPE